MGEGKNFELNRRKFLTAVGLVIAAPAIVQIGNIMPVRAVEFIRSKEIAYSVEYSVRQGCWVFVEAINGVEYADSQAPVLREAVFVS